ncbi:1,4-dihydroxy-2-naphthoate polyprenyltransferase [Georgenia thermotolerans]|uniref:1,4-dihydroxy-2-naphthoate octaprenyltransferase n=1 Tax=Georgenia thermotolerans TaxID=527326 RepID=A0A7J5UPM9_9MICO|nr:1,4-dihydroxy-2-naphthoate polyprenyltransferase [Georgenia thermotolerans]KAE8764368.1 1,4-dihydroxy-2-naphthoate polyprenyltransferase [Georgenia thermotolerans]
MATLTDWLEGARVRTLPAAVSPVIIGTGAAAGIGQASAGRALLAAGVALALQVGVNFANDYSDGVRGTDDVRTGPPRLTGGGKASPATVKRAAFLSFGVGAVLGLVLVALSGTWWLIAAGALAVVAAWGYTGGKHPYGYLGLGEVGVFVFFGLMATLGTTWTQALALPWTAWAGAVGVGLIACALLMVNNVRDLPTDAQVGKHTLAVRLGDRRARWGYVLMVWVPLALGVLCAFASPWALLVLLLVPWAVRVSRVVLGGAAGRDLIVVLRDTGLLELAYGVLLGLGLAL